MSEEYRLISVHDMREIDDATGKRADLSPEQKAVCEHCGRLIAKVYTVRRTSDQKEFAVGSACCFNLFGWEPEKEEIKRLLKEDKKRAENRVLQRLDALAQPIIAEVKSLTIPKIAKTGRIPMDGSGYRFVDVYEMPGTGVSGVWCPEGLTNERRNMCIEFWRKEEIEKRIAVLYPAIGESYPDWKRREKLKRYIESNDVWEMSFPTIS